MVLLASAQLANGRRAGVRRAKTRRALSLIESVVAVALIGFIVIGVVPLFQRAILNNIQGADASQMTAFSRSGLEMLLQRTANSATFIQDANDGSGAGTLFDSTDSVVRYNPLYFDTGERRVVDGQTLGLDDHYGDERWTSVPTEVEGVVLWRAYLQKREYNYSDIHFGTLNATGELIETGNPKLFDNPIPIVQGADRPLGYGGGDIAELRMIVESARGYADITQLRDETTSSNNTDHVAMSATGLQQKVEVGLFRVF